MAGRQDTGGLAAALALLGARGEVPAGSEAAAADLFGGFEAEDAPMPMPSKSGPRGGRPAGARNKSTEEWARFLLSKHRSPLTVLAEMYSRPLGELVDELQAMADKHKKWRETKDGGYWSVVQIDPLAVWKAQQAAALGLAPYVHKQQPKALEVETKPRGVVLLGDIDEAEVAGDDDDALPLPPTVENQGLVDAPSRLSDADRSDGD